MLIQRFSLVRSLQEVLAQAPILRLVRKLLQRAARRLQTF